MDNKDIYYVSRNLLRLVIDTEFNVLLNSYTALSLFRIYITVLKA